MSVFANDAFDGHEAVHFFTDAASGLRAVIAIHSTILGPAAGGCRMWPFADDRMALTDVLRLSRGMSLKNAMADLPLGGGKAVIIGDPRRHKTPDLLMAFGRAVDSLGGRYVTAEDVGMSVADMQVIRLTTRHVCGLPAAPGARLGGDPSPHTARGVFNGIRAAVRAKLGRDDLEGLRIAVQGLGHVGHALARLLHQAGARLVVADIDGAAVARAAEELGAETASPDEILFADVDVLAPCALGGVLNRDTIPRLRTPIVAGAANNQLLTDMDGTRLAERGILYAPDYVINAGGIIHVAAEYLDSLDADMAARKIEGIFDTLAEIFDRAARTGRPTNRIADEMALSRLKAGPRTERPRTSSIA